VEPASHHLTTVSPLDKSPSRKNASCRACMASSKSRFPFQPISSPIWWKVVVEVASSLASALRTALGPARGGPAPRSKFVPSSFRTGSARLDDQTLTKGGKKNHYVTNPKVPKVPRRRRYKCNSAVVCYASSYLPMLSATKARAVRNSRAKNACRVAKFHKRRRRDSGG